jgi:galactokinase/mevalonate kinase-like predicted kinase
MSDLMHQVWRQKRTINVSTTNFGIETLFEETEFWG